MITISKLHFITASPVEAEKACIGGVDWIQLRVKNKNEDEWKMLAVETQGICKKYGAKLIINDNVALAKEIKADGVHLGKEDMPVAEARKLLGGSFIIGGTANTFYDIKQLAENGADYIGLGPFRFTTTKKNLSPILGIEGYRNSIKNCRLGNINIPVIAIGGIRTEDIALLQDAGVYGIAVSSGISGAPDIIKATKDFLTGITITAA